MRKLRELHGHHEELWSSDAVEYAGDYPRLARRAQELEVHVTVLKAQVRAGDAEMAELRTMLAPPPPMAQGAYDERMRLMVMELMGRPTPAPRRSRASSTSSPATTGFTSPSG